MTDKLGIIIFTRDRPDRLRSGLGSIQRVKYKIVVIDDSVKAGNRVINREIVGLSGHRYVGQVEFAEFIRRHQIDLRTYSFLLRQLGNENWNLGYARNFALVIGKAAGFEGMLFMDDDIEVQTISLIDELFGLLDEYRFSGANIVGLIDDSILGHIATHSRIFNERMLSGGFMAFAPRNIGHYFLNTYNEDWIWLFLQTKDKSYIQIGEVMQALSDPLVNYTGKIMFQEFGEVMLDGVLDCYESDPAESLCSTLFWERMLKERKEYLEKLYEITELKNESKHLEIIGYVKENLKALNSEMFRELFEKYFSNLRVFQTLFNTLKE